MITATSTFAIPLRWAMPSALLGGLLIYGAFPPLGLGYLAPVGVGLMTLAVYRRSFRGALGLSALTGAAYIGPLLSWMQIPGLDAWLMLTMLCMFWIMLMGAGIARVTRLPGWPVWVACLWVLQEALRGRIPWGGFAWGDLAFSQADTPLGKYAAMIGRPGVTFIVALAGTLALTALLSLRQAPRNSAMWGGALLVVIGIGALVPTSPVTDGSLSIAVIQGGTPQLGLGAMDVRRQVLDNHVAQTLLLSRQVKAGRAVQPDFVLWPENSTDIDPFLDASAAADISRAAAAINAPILVGAVVEVPGNPQGIWNMGVLWDPVTGPGERYIKKHPVPFGEYVPMREQLMAVIGRFDRIPRDFLPGTQPGVLDVGGALIGDLICFEVTDDYLVQLLMAGGAQLLTVQTNNATFGGSAQPEQQLEIERLRAIETGRTVVVAATTGVSAFIGPDGVVREQLRQGEVGSMVEQVNLSRNGTLSSRLGMVPELVMCLLALVFATLGGGGRMWWRRDL